MKASNLNSTMKLQAVTILVFAIASVQGQDVPDTTQACPQYDCSVDSVNCFASPCSLVMPEIECPFIPNAKCCPNTCGGCFHYFIDASMNDITESCERQSRDCPPPTFDLACLTSADNSCTGDDSCLGEQICCKRNLCSTPTCVEPFDHCSLVRCSEPLCLQGYSPVTPEGECCQQCVRDLTCPDPVSAFPADATCPAMCDEDSACVEGQSCCMAEVCGNRICVEPVESCYNFDRRELISVGTTFQKDDCTICRCNDNGTITCRETCISQCPEITSDSGGICVVQCDINTGTGCQVGETCCTNNCGGTVCSAPEIMCISDDGPIAVGGTIMRDCNTCTCQSDGTFGCTEIFCTSYGCPAVSDAAVADECTVNFDVSCAGSDTECPEGERCCGVSAGCAPMCIQPVIVCRSDATGVAIQVGTTFSRPFTCDECTCNDDGTITCTARENCQTCEQDGYTYATGDTVPSRDTCNTCSCEGDGSIICSLASCPPACRGPGDAIYDVGQSFLAIDGCNTCECTSEGPICTQDNCGNPCYEPQAVGSCDAVVPRWWYDINRGVCSLFNYGGCEGNKNNFETQRECLQQCDRNSTCLATIYEIEPLCLIAPVQRWTYNLASGLCEQIDYIRCQSSDGHNVYSDESDCLEECVEGEAGPECPDDVPIALCFADPCQVNFCPNVPEARCESDFCGGCNAWFFDGDTNVTDRCYDVSTCEDGTPMVNCFINSCEVSRCPAFPDARCEFSNCGGCSASYFDSDGNDVTDMCRVLPTPLEFTQCPAVADGTVGICVQDCSSNRDCEDDKLCCSNGCGLTCQTGDTIPYYVIPTNCPTSFIDSITSCQFDEDTNCLSDDECTDENELCCHNGCSRTCQAAETSPIPCFDVTDPFSDFGTTAMGLFDTDLLGVYRPQCTEDGLFAPVQCHSSTGYCWCVHVQTGLPTSARTERGTMPSCLTCQEGGEMYYPGESFPSSDGCNDCWCSESGFVSCTRRECVDTCELEPDTGTCRGSFPGYYHDSSDGVCKRFTYGGCGGNANKFFTLGDCIRRCIPDSICLDATVVRSCDDTIQVPQYFLNVTSGRCEQYFWRGCETENRFESGEECRRRCDPDGEYIDSCLGIQCDFIECPSGSVFVSDGSCCGGDCSDVGTEIECEDDEKMCSDGSGCVSESNICDLLRDCEDGSDETDCPEPPSDCTGGFLCPSSLECIPINYKCDDYPDCRDGSDELFCRDIPLNTQYISRIPRECPPANDQLSDCSEDTCAQDTDCEEGNEMCCPSSCGMRQCLVGVPVTPLCSTLRREIIAMEGFGVFAPECDREGFFTQQQCHEAYCWCVNVQTGYPLTEGQHVDSGPPICSGCQLREDDVSSLIPFGETYAADDGCNRCFCTDAWPEERCTNDRCPVACRLDDLTIDHMSSFEDECIKCNCAFGALDCERKECISASPIRQPTRVRMPFNGDFDAILSDDDKREEFKREVQRTLLTFYAQSLGLRQDQIMDINFMKGSVIVFVELADSESLTSANLTVLLSQLQQDYGTGTLVIRYGNSVLQPTATGEFIIVQDSAISQPWVIAVIVIAGVLAIVAIVAIIIALVLCMRARRGHSSSEYSSGKASTNDYNDPVTFNPSENTVKVPLD